MDAPEVVELMGFDPAGASRAELERRIGQYGWAESVLAARRLACMAELDGRGDGGVDAEQVLRARTRCSTKKAKRAAKTARALEHMPRARAALGAGQISESHADALADAAERTSDRQADIALAGDASKRPADLFAKQAREWANRNEEDADQQARHERQVNARRATVWTTEPDGMTALHAEFDPVEGGLIDNAVAREVDRLWQADGGRDGTPDQIRRPQQRRADAIANLILGRVPGAGGNAGARPHPRYVVGVRVDATRLRTEDPHGIAELTDGTPLPRSVLERIACEGALVAQIFDTDGAVLWQGRERRLATDEQWTALIARDGGCFCCGTDPSRCHAHHLDPWAPPANGTTDVDRLVLVCTRTHHLIHDHGWTIERVDDRWTLHRPTGPPSRHHHRRPAA